MKVNRKRNSLIIGESVVRGFFLFYIFSKSNDMFSSPQKKGTSFLSRPFRQFWSDGEIEIALMLNSDGIATFTN